jgi:hypothetical protein
MPRVEQDLELYTNADEIFTIAVTDENGDPVDLTTFDSLCWVLMKGRAEVVRYDDSDPELTIAGVDGTDDGLRVNLVPAVTGALDCGRLYTHQAWGVYSGRERPLCIGYVTVERGDGC